jgi:hypothetical protein
METVPKEAWEAIASVLAILISVIAAVFAARQKSKSDESLEAYKLELNKRMADYEGKIEEQHSESAARREYEFEARKRLYEECEPLIFRFSDNASNAYYRVLGLARANRENVLQSTAFLGSFDYYFKSTIYKLFAPLAIYRLMQDKLTFVDLKLDDKIRLQYLIIKQVYLLWTDDFGIARKLSIAYEPNQDDWRELRKNDQAKYWRQGLPMGLLDIVIDLLLKTENNEKHLMTYGEFEIKIDNDDYTKKQLDLFNDILRGFTPVNRPVLWTILVTQAILFQGLLKIQSAETPKIVTDDNWYEKYFLIDKTERGELYVTLDIQSASAETDHILSVAENYIKEKLN